MVHRIEKFYSMNFQKKNTKNAVTIREGFITMLAFIVGLERLKYR